jgi:zinc transport system substrate-binding protein
MDRRLYLAIILIAVVSGVMGVAYIARPQPLKGGKLIVVATFYPIYYLAERIGGDMVEVHSLIQPGMEVHSWQPAVKDIVACSDADIIIYNGAGLDDWLHEEVLPLMDVEGKLIIDTTENVTLWENIEKKEIEEHGLYDPHTWISPYEARQQAETIYRAFIERDPDNLDYYTDRWMALSNDLKTLDESYKTKLQSKVRDSIFVTHDAFGYIARRYGFKQQGIIGVSADEQPSTQTIAQIVDMMQQTGTYVFYIEPGYSDIYVQTVKTELQIRTGKTIHILELYHLNGPIDGLDYIQQMEKNLVNLQKGLE